MERAEPPRLRGAMTGAARDCHLGLQEARNAHNRILGWSLLRPLRPLRTLMHLPGPETPLRQGREGARARTQVQWEVPCPSFSQPGR